jgi:hypothetical protein
MPRKTQSAKVNEGEPDFDYVEGNMATSQMGTSGFRAPSSLGSIAQPGSNPYNSYLHPELSMSNPVGGGRPDEDLQRVIGGKINMKKVGKVAKAAYESKTGQAVKKAAIKEAKKQGPKLAKAALKSALSSGDSSDSTPATGGSREAQLEKLVKMLLAERKGGEISGGKRKGIKKVGHAIKMGARTKVGKAVLNTAIDAAPALAAEAAIASGNPELAPVAALATQQALKGKKRGGGAASGKRSERGAIVKRIMAERGVSLPQASKIVKEEGLY